MHQHRFQSHLASYRLPKPPSVTVRPGSFTFCPALLPAGQALWQWAVYQRAFAEAQAVVRPSLPERDLLGVWN